MIVFFFPFFSSLSLRGGLLFVLFHCVMRVSILTSLVPKKHIDIIITIWVFFLWIIIIVLFFLSESQCNDQWKKKNTAISIIMLFPLHKIH